MPNRYEREIEEILRNLEQSNTVRSGDSTRFQERVPRKSAPRIRRPQFFGQLAWSERLFLIAVILAMVAGAYAYTTQRADLFSMLLVLIAIVCLVLVACSSFSLFQPRRPQSTRYRNASSTITITPLHRNPFSRLKTQWNLFILRRRLRRKEGPIDD